MRKFIIISLLILLFISCKSVPSEINFSPPPEKDMTVGQNGLTEEDYWNMVSPILTYEDLIFNTYNKSLKKPSK